MTAFLLQGFGYITQQVKPISDLLGLGRSRRGSFSIVSASAFLHIVLAQTEMA